MSDTEEQVPTRADEGSSSSVHDEDEEDFIHDPWRASRRFFEEFTPERLDLEVNRAFSRRAQWLLRCDSIETKKDILYSCELPGVDKDDISVEVKGRRLLINGERKAPAKQATKDARVYLEQRYGHFSKRLFVPSGIDAKTIDARLNHGVLNIRVPKPEVKETDKVNINVG